jgi:hypothetical protein
MRKKYRDHVQNMMAKRNKASMNKQIKSKKWNKIIKISGPRNTTCQLKINKG